MVELIRITEEEFERGYISSGMKKKDFNKEFKKIVLEWIKEKEPEILRTLHERRYSWHGESFEESVRRRDQLEIAIKESRKRNSGGVDLRTLDQICLWGFGQSFPLRDQQAAIDSTREAFANADNEDYCKAVWTLMNISGVGISRASKIIGLSDQNRLCIYDSRVGHALKDLKKGNIKLVKCPPDRSYKRDCDSSTKSGWAANYEKFIWTIEIMQDYFKTKQHPLRSADIEIALFVMGE